MEEENKKHNKNNKGTVYPNLKKQDKQPDYRGKINIEGQDYRISGWIHIIDNVETIKFLLVKEEVFLEKMETYKKQQEEKNKETDKAPIENIEPKPEDYVYEKSEEHTEAFDPIFSDIFKDLNF